MESLTGQEKPHEDNQQTLGAEDIWEVASLVEL